MDQYQLFFKYKCGESNLEDVYNTCIYDLKWPNDAAIKFTCLCMISTDNHIFKYLPYKSIVDLYKHEHFLIYCQLRSISKFLADRFEEAYGTQNQHTYYM